VVPILFLIGSTFLIFMTIINTPRQSAVGLVLILMGVPVYWFLRSRPDK
jgi:hypothetical protein